MGAERSAMTQTEGRREVGPAVAPGRWEGGDIPDRVRLRLGPVLTGDESVVLPGVGIGVASDCEPWTVVAGNPARVLRRLASPERSDWPTGT